MKKDNNQKNTKMPKKPLIYYYIIAMVVFIALNTFVFPSMLEAKIEEVDYRTFLQMLNNDEISKVEVTDTQILFTSPDGKDGEIIYTTGIMPDLDLTNRLYEADVEFGKVVPQELHPLVALLIRMSPMLLFLGFGLYMSRSMQKKWRYVLW